MAAYLRQKDLTMAEKRFDYLFSLTERKACIFSLLFCCFWVIIVRNTRWRVNVLIWMQLGFTTVLRVWSNNEYWNVFIHSGSVMGVFFMLDISRVFERSVYEYSRDAGLMSWLSTEIFSTFVLWSQILVKMFFTLGSEYRDLASAQFVGAGFVAPAHHFCDYCLA